MAYYGYARVSTKTQRLDRQIDNIMKAYPEVEWVYTEKFTGTKVYGRTEFLKLQKKVKAGDTIVFDSVSRMSRDACEGVELYMNFYNLGVNLVFLKEPYINSSVYKSASEQTIGMTGNDIADIYIEATNRVIKLLAEKQIVSAFQQSEKEVQDIQKRVSEGMKATQRRNEDLPPEQQTQIGLKKGSKLVTKKSIAMKDKIQKMAKDFNGNMTDKEVIETLKIARNSYYKYKKQLFEEMANGSL